MTATTRAQEQQFIDCMFDVCIIGGGVVGLAVLRAATLAGYKCVLIEKESDLLSCASGSNSGIACTGVDASPGTLERALIRDSISQLRYFLRNHNIPHRPCGSLVCKWPWDNDNNTNQNEDDRLDEVLAESHDAGDTHATRLSSEAVHELEPNLTDRCQGAVHIPGETVVDPWLFSIAFAVHARENGATIVTNFEFDASTSSWDDDTETWTIQRNCHANHGEESSNNDTPRTLNAKAIVNATGIQADLIQSTAGSNTCSLPVAHWTARPRRGQYRVFSSTPTTRFHHPIQPVPTQRTKGIFVFSSLYDQILVGPTALDQELRTDRTIDPVVATELTDVATRMLPGLQPEQDFIGDYVGIRPGTDFRDYQIRMYASCHWIVAAGIRSSGLTASLGIGRHVVHLLQMILPVVDTNEFQVKTTPLPPVQELVEMYHDRGDGTVVIDSHEYRVTHPITKFGWEAKSGIASSNPDD